MPSFLRLSGITYSWPSQVHPLFENLDFALETGWTGFVGPNGCGKTTLLRIISGELTPEAGRIDPSPSALLCDQRTDEPPENLSDLLCFPDAHSGRLASRLRLEGDWPWRWDTLSHGERKRAQVAVALWRDPDVLLADEPTNHLDAEAREMLAGALGEYRGIGLIVSHDRALLDRLCSKTLFLEEGAFRMRPGGVTAGLAEIEKERIRDRREYEEARREVKRLEAEAQRRALKAATNEKKNAKRRLDPKDRDGREKIDIARILGRDGTAGRLKSRMDDRVEAARERSAATANRITRPGGITLSGRKSSSDRLVSLPAGRLDFGGGTGLEWPDLEIGPEDRIALTGPNGAGKSRLLSLLLESYGGTPGEASGVLAIPQEVPEDTGRGLMDRIAALGRDEKGEVFSAVNRLGSDPERLMRTASPSPGETRKLLLALGLADRPAWIAMDEPTNHMDLFSVRHLESALAGFPGALLLVSHDAIFLDALTEIEWRIASSGAFGRLEIRPAT